MLLNIPPPNILLVVSFNFSPCSQTSLVSPLLGGGGCGVTRARRVPRQLPVTTSSSGPLTLETTLHTNTCTAPGHTCEHVTNV